MAAILDHTGKPWTPDGNGNGGVDRPFDRLAVPTVLTHSAIVGSAFRAFWHGRHDAARRHSREDSLVMRHEAWLMALMQERKLSVASLKWHIEVDDDRDTKQRDMKNGITKLIASIPRWKRLLMSMLEALWYGRYGLQLLWKWGTIGNRRALSLKAHYPVNGDKIGHTFNHEPYVLVNPAYTEQVKGRPEFISTTEGGRGLVLKGSWRERFLIHTHEVDDPDYFEGEQADAIHGIGLRDRLYFTNYLKKEWLAHVTDWAERVGLGVTLIRYPGGNVRAKAEAEQAARDVSRRAVITWPVYEDDRVGGIERVEVPTGGAQLLLMLLEHLEGHEERYIVGQSLSAGTEGGGLGGTGVAQMHADTKYRITAFDADMLGETLTGSEDEPGLVWIIKRWTYPEMRDVPCRLKFDVDPPDAERVLGQVVQAINVGVDFIKDDVRALTGLSCPGIDDDVVSLAAIQQQQLQAAAAAQGGMGGVSPEEDPHADLMAKLGQPDPDFDSLETGETPEQYASRVELWRYVGRQGAANPANPGAFAPGGTGVEDVAAESPPIKGAAKQPQPPQLAARKPPRPLTATTLRGVLRHDDAERTARHLLDESTGWHRLHPEDREAAHGLLSRLSTRQAWQLMHHLAEQAPRHEYGPLTGAREILEEHLSNSKHRERGKALAYDEERHGKTARVIDTSGLAEEDMLRARAAMGSLPRVQGVEDAYHIPTGVDVGRALHLDRPLTRELDRDEIARARAVALAPKPTETLHEGELRRISTRNARGLARIFSRLPSDEEFAATALLGKANRGWYADSVQALRHVFGADADRFAAVLAATSPRQPVKQNLVKALAIWTAWNAAGRPTQSIPFVGSSGVEDPEDNHRLTMEFLRRIPAGEFGGHRNNVVRALTHPEDRIVLSGNKVQSFYRNLIGDLGESTNDVWMANFGGIDQNRFGSASGYLAFTAKVRRVARQLGWQPAEVQETIWSAFRTLAALQQGGLSAAEALARMQGDSPQRAEDFAQLFGDPDVQAALERTGALGGRTGAGAVPGNREQPEVPRVSGSQADPAFARRLETTAARLLERVAQRAGQFTSSVDAPSKAQAIVQGDWSGTHHERDESTPEQPARYAATQLRQPAAPSQPRPPARPTQVQAPALPRPLGPKPAQPIRLPAGVGVEQAKGIHRELRGLVPLEHHQGLVDALRHEPHHNWLLGRHLAGDHPTPDQLARSVRALAQHRAEAAEYPHLHEALHAGVSHQELHGLMRRHQMAKDRFKTYTFREPPGAAEEVTALPSRGDAFLASPVDPAKHPYHPRVGESVYLKHEGRIAGLARVVDLRRTSQGLRPVLRLNTDRHRDPHDWPQSDAYMRGYDGGALVSGHPNPVVSADLERMHRLGAADRENWRPYGHSAPGLLDEPHDSGDWHLAWRGPGATAARTFTRRWLRQHGLEPSDSRHDAMMGKLLALIHRNWALQSRASEDAGEPVGRMRLLRTAQKTLEHLFPAGRHPYDRHVFDPQTGQASPLLEDVFGQETLDTLRRSDELHPGLRALAHRAARDPAGVPKAVAALADLHENRPKGPAGWWATERAPLREAAGNIQQAGLPPLELLSDDASENINRKATPELVEAGNWLRRHVPQDMTAEQLAQYDTEHVWTVQNAFLHHVAREIAGHRKANPWQRNPAAVRDYPSAEQWRSLAEPVPPEPAELRETAARDVFLPPVAYLPKPLQHLAQVARHAPRHLRQAIGAVLRNKTPWPLPTPEQLADEQNDRDEVERRAAAQGVEPPPDRRAWAIGKANHQTLPIWHPDDAREWLRTTAPQVLDHPEVPHPNAPSDLHPYTQEQRNAAAWRLPDPLAPLLTSENPGDHDIAHALETMAREIERRRTQERGSERRMAGRVRQSSRADQRGDDSPRGRQLAEVDRRQALERAQAEHRERTEGNP